MSGWAGRFSLSKQRGNWLFNTALGAISPGFETNDAGYQRGGDLVNSHLTAGYIWYKPGKVLRSWNIFGATFCTYDFGGNRINGGYLLSYNLQFLNYWGINNLVAYVPRP